MPNSATTGKRVMAVRLKNTGAEPISSFPQAPLVARLQDVTSKICCCRLNRNNRIQRDLGFTDKEHLTESLPSWQNDTAILQELSRVEVLSAVRRGSTKVGEIEEIRSPLLFCGGGLWESLCWRSGGVIFSSLSLQRASSYSFECKKLYGVT